MWPWGLLRRQVLGVNMIGRLRAVAVNGSTLLMLFLPSGLVLAQIAREETIDANEFAARCDSGGFTLSDNLRVRGGIASLGECSVTVGSFHLVIQDAQFSVSGPLNVAAQPDGELHVQNSQFVQSAEVKAPLNVIFRPHRSRLENTVLDFVGLVTVGSGAADNGENIVHNCRLRSREAKIHIGSSGRGEEGHTEVKGSELWAAVEISIDASPQVPHGRGDVLVEGNTIVSQGTIIIDTGEDGRTRVRRNGDGEGGGIYSTGTTMIFSGAGGETQVNGNRLLANQGLEIFSGERTTVRRNNFSDGGPVLIRGPRCHASHNIPEVVCEAQSIDAVEFAKRCAQAQGHLSIDADLVVEGGVAEIAECRVALAAVRLDFRGVEFAASGFFMIDGQPDGEIRVERSRLIQSPVVREPVNILLRAHHLGLRTTVLDFLGTVHLETGAADRGQLQVESSVLRSSTGDIHLGSSGRGLHGSTVVKDCELFAATDGISILASAIAPHGAGRIQVEESYLQSPGTIVIQTSEDGRTTVNENRIIAEEEATISSGGRTRVNRNNFVGSGDITINGPSCEARGNVPEVECSG